MRLIDADALDYALGASDEDINFHFMLEYAPTIDAIPVEIAAKKLQRSFHSENWESWAEWLRGNYTDEDFVAHKDDKRNAIPVEWMASWINRHPNDLRCAWFASLEMEWRKEQEAR